MWSHSALLLSQDTLLQWAPGHDPTWARQPHSALPIVRFESHRSPGQWLLPSIIHRQLVLLSIAVYSYSFNWALTFFSIALFILEPFQFQFLYYRLSRSLQEGILSGEIPPQLGALGKLQGLYVPTSFSFGTTVYFISDDAPSIDIHLNPCIFFIFSLSLSQIPLRQQFKWHHPASARQLN